MLKKHTWKNSLIFTSVCTNIDIIRYYGNNFNLATIIRVQIQNSWNNATSGHIVIIYRPDQLICFVTVRKNSLQKVVFLTAKQQSQSKPLFTHAWRLFWISALKRGHLRRRRVNDRVLTQYLNIQHVFKYAASFNIPPDTCARWPFRHSHLFRTASKILRDSETLNCLKLHRRERCSVRARQVQRAGFIRAPCKCGHSPRRMRAR